MTLSSKINKMIPRLLETKKDLEFDRRVRERDREAENIVGRIRTNVLSRFEIGFVSEETENVLNFFNLGLIRGDWIQLVIDGVHYGDLLLVENGHEKSIHCSYRCFKGCEFPLHTHPHDEHFIVQSGKVELLTESTNQKFYPNDHYFIPAEQQHKLAVWPDTQLAMLFYSG